MGLPRNIVSPGISPQGWKTLDAGTSPGGMVVGGVDVVAVVVEAGIAAAVVTGGSGSSADVGTAAVVDGCKDAVVQDEMRIARATQAAIDGKRIRRIVGRAGHKRVLPLAWVEPRVYSLRLWLSAMRIFKSSRSRSAI